MYYATRKALTKECRTWQHHLMHQLSLPENAQSLAELSKHFDHNKHVYKIKIVAYYPKEILLRGDGSISSKSFDITNIEKPLVDVIFLPKYNELSPPYGCSNLSIDDKYIVKCISEKRISNTGMFYIDVFLAISDLEIYKSE